MPSRPAVHRAHACVRQTGRRPSARQRGYTTRWDKARATYLAHHPLCVTCLAESPQRLTPATTVDHVVPHRGDQSMFWDVDGNWQALCTRHHNEKTARGE